MGPRVFHDSISMFVGEGDNSLLPRWALGCDLDLLAGGLLSAVLWISMILLSGRAGNTSFILRILTADAVTCAYDLVGFILLVSLAFRPDWLFLSETQGNGWRDPPNRVAIRVLGAILEGAARALPKL